MAKIDGITFYHDHNYVKYDDTDIQTDYYHSYLLGQRDTLEWVKKDGGSIINIRVVNDDPKIPAERRLMQLAKLGYRIEDLRHIHIFNGINGEKRPVSVLEWKLTK